MRVRTGVSVLSARSRRAGVLLISAALTASILVGSAAAADEPIAADDSSAPVKVAKPTDSDDDGKLDAPDSVSASAGAMAAKKPVESLEDRTETSTTTANPDGTFTLLDYQSPVRIKRDGEWLDIDPTLEKQPDGSYRPKVSAADIVISGGGDKDAGQVTFDDGRSVAVTWPAALPEPTIDGGVATYRLSESTDLLMIVGDDGVAARIRLNQRPADDDPVFTFGLRTDDLTVAEDSTGGLSLKDDEGNAIGGTSKLVAWDAKTDEAGQPLDKVALDADLDQTAKSGDVVTHDLDLTTPAGFLTDPDTEFPVIVDPDIAGMEALADTWVREGDTSDHSNETQLVVGKSANPGYSAISFVKWSLGRIPANATVISANLSLHQWFAASCGPTSMVVQPVAQDWGAQNLQYTTRPASHSFDYQYVSDNRGYQCGNSGRVSLPATNYVNNWRAGFYGNYGLRLGVPQANEGQSSYQRRFCSYHALSSDANCPNAAYEPALAVTYNQPPNTPSLEITRGGNPATVYATVSDPNPESNLRVYVAVRTSDGADVWGGYSNSTSGTGSQQVRVRLPYLPRGNYKMESQAVDDNNATSGVSPSTNFSIETEFGSQSWFSTTQHGLTDRSGLQVNNRTGNLAVQASDISVNSRGIDLDVTRMYNSQSVQAAASNTGGDALRTGTSMGKGWSLSVGPDVWLEKNGQNFDYHAPGGTVFGAFKPDSDTSDPDDFKKPRGGVGADLKRNTNGSFTLTFRKSQLKYDFEVRGTGGHAYLKTIRDRSDNKIQFSYALGSTPNGRPLLTTILDATGRSFAVTYTGDSITSISGPTTGTNARTWSYEYTDGYLTKYTDPASKATNYSYDPAGTPGAKLLRTITGPRTTASFEYYTSAGEEASDLDRLKKTKYQADASTPYEFTWNYRRRNTVAPCNDASEYATTVTDARAKITSYCFTDDSGTGPDGTKTRVFDALDNVKQTGYTADQGMKTVTSPENSGTAVNGSTVAGYGTISDQLNTITEPKTSSSQSTSAPVTTFAYDHGDTSPAGGTYLPSTIADPNSDCSTYEYNEQGYTTAAYTGLIAAAGTCTKGTKLGFHREYNSDGTVRQSWDANAFGAGDTEQSNLGEDRKTVYTYWEAGQTGGNVGQLKTIRKPGGSCDAPRKLCTSYEYDGLGRVGTVTDGRGKVTRYAYDALDRNIAVYFNNATSCATGNTNCVTYTYDDEGNLTTRVDKSGTSTFAYDGLNRQISQTSPGTTVGLKYDGNGNLTEHSQQVTGQAAQVTTYGYDDANRNITVSVAGTTIRISPDKDGRVKQIEFPTNGTGTGLRANYEFNKAGKPKSANVTSASGNTLRKYEYDYTKDLVDGPGEVLVESDQLQRREIKDSGAALNSITTYKYEEGRLKEATDNNGPSWIYTHDKVGNVLSEQTAGTTTYFGYDRAGQYCWGGPSNGSPGDQLDTTCHTGPSGSFNLGHDAAGNNTALASNPITYNDDSQVTSIDGVAQAYLDRGNNLRTTAGGTNYLNTPLGVGAQKVGTQYSYTVRDPKGTILATYGPLGTTYFFSEYNGNVAALYSSAGAEVGSYKYGPYGKTTVSGSVGALNPIRYLGAIQDKTSTGADGGYKLGARYYDARGHFTQPDSIAGTINDPKTLTSYNYAGGDPINSGDPSGNSFQDFFEKVGPVGDIIEGTRAIQNGDWNKVAGIIVGEATGAAFTGSCLGTFGLTLVGAPLCPIVGVGISEANAYSTETVLDRVTNG